MLRLFRAFCAALALALAFAPAARAQDTPQSLQALIASSIGDCPAGKPLCMTQTTLAGVLMRMAGAMWTTGSLLPPTGTCTGPFIGHGAIVASTCGMIDAQWLSPGAAAANLGNGGVTSSMLASGAAAANLGAGSVTPAMLANGAAATNLGLNGASVGRHVPTLAALKIVTTPAVGDAIWRDGTLAPGDMPPTQYVYSASACSMNSGAGDGGAQIAPTSYSGCWIAVFPVTGADVHVWNCPAGGVTDATACIQAAMNAVANTNIPLVGIMSGKYLISGTLTGSPSQTIIIEGVPSALDHTASSCPFGLYKPSDGDAIFLQGSRSVVRGLCVQMGTGVGQRASGAGIHVGSLGGSTMSGALVERNMVLYSYDGIAIGGTTNGSAQTNGVRVIENFLISNSRYSISNGATSYGVSTNGTVYRDNKIVCNSASTSSVGYALFDGAVDIYAGDNGPYNCGIGTAIIPGGTDSSHKQTALGLMEGVVGDTSQTTNLLINPQTAYGSAMLWRFNGAWVGAANYAGSKSIDIRNDGGAANACRLIMFNGLQSHGQASGSQDIVRIGGNCKDITINGSQIFADAGNTAQTGIEIADTASQITLTNNLIGDSLYGGSLAQSINITSTADLFTITGNFFGSTPIASTILWPTSTYSSGVRATIADNTTTDNGNFPTLPIVSNSITVPIQSNFSISGGGTLSQMSGPLLWANRKVWVTPTSPVTIATGGTDGAFCFGGRTITYSFIATWSGSCWLFSGS